MTNGVNLLMVANRDQLLLDNHLLIYIGHGHWVHHATNGLTPELRQIIRFGAAITFLCNGLALFLNRPVTLSLELLTSIVGHGHWVKYAT
jgi:hypothetical protein